MLASELIPLLQAAILEHGDLPVLARERHQNPAVVALGKPLVRVRPYGGWFKDGRILLLDHAEKDRAW